MQLLHTFEVNGSAPHVWDTFQDLHQVAGCMPGAQLEEVDGDEFTGSLKLKIGALHLQFRGAGRITERDDAARRLVVHAKGKDKKGTGAAEATVSVTLAAAGDQTTQVEVVTDLKVSGRLAQLGQAAMHNVGNRLTDEFATCLAAELSQEPDMAIPSAGSQDASAPVTTGTAPAAALDLVDLVGEGPKRVGLVLLAFLAGLLVGSGRRKARAK